jgi:hypothetical protein
MPKEKLVPMSGDKPFQGLPFTKNGLPATRDGINGHKTVKLPFTKTEDKK